LYSNSITSDFPTSSTTAGFFEESVPGLTNTPPPFSFDDHHLWAEDNSLEDSLLAAAVTATSGSGTNNEDFDWTALGLDCFGTQLLQPGHFELGLESQQQTTADALNLTTSQGQQQQEADLLFGGNDLGNDIAMSAIDSQSINLESGGGTFDVSLSSKILKI
jgi:hypothetical protein